MTQKVPQKRKKSQEVTIEDIYHNKNFVKPKEKPLETIFEEPKVSRDGTEHYTSVKRYKRYLLFDEYPNSDKLRKRKMRVKKLQKCPIPEGRLTRSRNKRPRLLSDISEQEFGGGDGVMVCLPEIKDSNMVDNIIHRNRILQHDGYALRATSSANYKEISSEESESDEDVYRVPVKVIVAEDTPRSHDDKQQSQTEKDMDLVVEDEDMIVQTDVSDSDENANTKIGTSVHCDFKSDCVPPLPSTSASDVNSEARQTVSVSTPSRGEDVDKADIYYDGNISDSPDLVKNSLAENKADCEHGSLIKTNMCEVT